MKTIPTHQIKEDGLTLELSDKEEWVVEILKNLFPDHPVDLKTVSGSIDLQNNNGVIACTGSISFTHHPPCARCGKDLDKTESVSFSTNFAPLTPDKQKALSEKHTHEEVELTEEDLSFSFYSNEEITLDPILNDEIALTLPYNYYCEGKQPCKPQLPNDPHITFNDDSDPHWAPLKDLKITKK